MTLKVIGSGFGRTGTMSLKLALERLGFGPTHHMVEVFQHPETIPLWIDAADGKADWPKVFEGYRSAVDWPTATFYRELAEAYPDARIVHTERDPEAWFKSTQATIFARDFPPDSTDPWTIMASKVVARLFDMQMHDKDRLISVFKAHNARVREVIPADRLLVFEVAQGWGPLCDFLGVPTPDEPMPKVNSTEEFQGRIQKELEARAASKAEPA